VIKVKVNGIAYLAHNDTNYVSIDKDGSVWEYEYEPAVGISDWSCNADVGEIINPEINHLSDWKNSLIKINKEEK